MYSTHSHQQHPPTCYPLPPCLPLAVAAAGIPAGIQIQILLLPLLRGCSDLTCQLFGLRLEVDNEAGPPELWSSHVVKTKVALLVLMLD